MVDFSLPFHRFTRGHGVQLKDDGAWRRQGQQISKLIGLGDAKSKTRTAHVAAIEFDARFTRQVVRTGLHVGQRIRPRGPAQIGFSVASYSIASTTSVTRRKSTPGLAGLLIASVNV